MSEASEEQVTALRAQLERAVAATPTDGSEGSGHL
jgi:hypothetical protein